MTSSWVAKVKAFFGMESAPRWNMYQCNVCGKLTMSRIDLQVAKKTVAMKGARGEIATLMREGKWDLASAKAEGLLREQKLLAVYARVKFFCELFLSRLQVLEANEQIPDDMLTCLASLVVAASGLAIPELNKISLMIAHRYGEDWAKGCRQNFFDCVDSVVQDYATRGLPAREEVLETLENVAIEHEVQWDPTKWKREQVEDKEESTEEDPVPEFPPGALSEALARLDRLDRLERCPREEGDGDALERRLGKLKIASEL
ncbi:uncharacterized protein LOC126323763 [Schistocerca gregaria]|uniref:uncharacterized protein LOC126323763 n=1 Tax=Schistocerca gregaria TaxID=7010 RepID=UPI00211E528F|nr:uncharacterized protein LOC126323763 [Schistocerca gregaria]